MRIAIVYVMESNKIIKQNLLAEPISENALKLARAIYNTYITLDEELSLEIKIPTFFKLLNLQPCTDSIKDIQNLLEELNEPLAVRKFEFNGRKIQLKFIQFCNYTINEKTVTIRKILASKIDEMELAVRSYNCLQAAGIKNIVDLVQIEENAMLKYKNFGRKSLTELIEKLDEMGLHFGMDVNKYIKEEA